MNKINEIFNEIKRLEKELIVEIQNNEKEFFYKLKDKKVLFEEETQEYQKTFLTKISVYLSTASLFNILTLPFIWSCIIPAVFMDVVVSLYQFFCFKVYNIPRVNRGKYIVIDHYSLSYLNIIEKINCMYCGYFNGLIAYAQEIAARTEQYWCPIKHASKLAAVHSRYHKFFEYGDCEDYQKRFEALRKDFDDLKEEK